VTGTFVNVGGLTGNHDTLFTQAPLDGFASVALAASLGWASRCRRSAS
jgi:uncharacterized membrane protein YqgA involved in biofilm formation